MRFFNTAGPVNFADHYCLPPLSRFNLPQILGLIEQKKYFVLHAPRQTGKTSCLLALMEYLNREGRYRALYANLEAAQGAREDVRRGIKAVLTQLATRARDYLQDTFLMQRLGGALDEYGEDSALEALLTLWSQASPYTLVPGQPQAPRPPDRRNRLTRGRCSDISAPAASLRLRQATVSISINSHPLRRPGCS
ncbi:MAG: hypothetical protein NTY37_13300 [Methanothrix sp.]|nr:hypothetical protein [Methanothrix sp.]